MLELTHDAQRFLIGLRRARGVDDRAGVRLASKGGRVGLIFTPAPVSGHRVLKSEGIEVYVPNAIAEVLDGSIIDVQHESGRTSLVIRRRSANR